MQKLTLDNKQCDKKYKRKAALWIRSASLCVPLFVHIQTSARWHLQSLDFQVALSRGRGRRKRRKASSSPFHNTYIPSLGMSIQSQ